MDSVYESIMVGELFLKRVLAIAFVEQEVFHTLVNRAWHQGIDAWEDGEASHRALMNCEALLKKEIIVDHTLGHRVEMHLNIIIWLILWFFFK